MEMEINCIGCKNKLSNCEIEYSCKHFLCNTCLSRELLLSKFKTIINSDGFITLNCSCGGGSSNMSLNECQNKLINTNQIKTDKICSKHYKSLNLYCSDCRIWLCEDCVSQFHEEYFKNHQVSSRGEQLSNSKCFYHREETKTCICKKCNDLICSECITDESSEHINHATFTVKEYQKIIRNKKNELKYKKYEDLEMFINDKKSQIFKEFNMTSLKVKNIVDKGIKYLTELRDKYVEKTSLNMKNLNMKFNIIKQVYYNYYKELNDDKLNMISLEFLSQIKQELQNITFSAQKFESLSNAIDTLPNIENRPVFELGLSFRKLKYDKITDFDTNSPITSICNVQKISTLVCGLENGTINVYKNSSIPNEQHIEILGHTGPVNAIAEISNIKEGGFVTGSSDKLIRIWTFDLSGTTSTSYDKFVSSISTRTNASSERSVQLAQSTKEKNFKISCLYTISSMHFGTIIGLLELSNGSIASSSSDNTIKIWSIPDKEEAKKKENDNFDTKEIIILEEGGTYESCLLQIDDDTIASGSGDGRVKLWSIKCASVFKFLIGHSSYVSCLLKISKQKIISGGSDCRIIIWNLLDDNNKILFGHRDIVKGLVELQNNRLGSCSNDRTIRIWDLNDLCCLYCIKNAHSSAIYGIAKSSDNKIITGGNDSKINIFNGDEDLYTDNIIEAEEKYDDFN